MFIKLETGKWQEGIDITDRINEAVRGRKGKACLIFCPHTTAGLLVNEGQDKNVILDIIDAVDEIEPKLDYMHKNNAQSHVKASLIQTSLLIPMKNDKLELGKWQKIFFIEFDGPKEREIQVEVL